MNCLIKIALCSSAVLYLGSAAFAQNAPPSYQAAPDVYKVVFEDPNFRVIAATWPTGHHDRSHSHPLASIIYFLTDCAIRLSTPDGKSVDVNVKAGASNAAPVTASHSAENIGPGECRAVLVERK